jgi:hypothetical protein
VRRNGEVRYDGSMPSDGSGCNKVAPLGTKGRVGPGGAVGGPNAVVAKEVFKASG